MNCNFLFRGINCRPCRSLRWIRPRSPPPLLSLSLLCLCCWLCDFSAVSLPLFLSLSVSLLFFLRPFCCFVSLCIYVSYLFIYLKHCALVLLYFNMFFHPQSLCIRLHCTACGHVVHVAPSWAVPGRILWSLDVLYELSAKYSHLLICQQAINCERSEREGNGQWITHAALPRGSRTGLHERICKLHIR